MRDGLSRIGMRTAKKREAGVPRGQRVPKRGLHRCTKQCRHVCGDAGGRTSRGKPCKRPGGAGAEGVKLWSLVLCNRHQLAKNTRMAEVVEEELEMLGGKRAKFVMEYCGPSNCNGTEAVKRAGFAPGGSRLSHQTRASLLLKEPLVKAAILKRFNELSAPSEEIIHRMTADARMNIAGLITFDKDGVPRMELTKEALKVYGTLIKELELDDKGRVTKVKLNDSQAARRDLARIRQLFTDNPTINIFNLHDLSDVEVSKRLEAARSRMTLRHYHGNGEEGS